MSREGQVHAEILFPFMENAGPMCRARVYSSRLRYEAASEAGISWWNVFFSRNEM